MAPDRHDGSSLPETCGIAFKEWAGVCAALGAGRQTLIVRKGGIAEGPRGFVPEHPTFWLYPTHVHQAEQGLRAVPPDPYAVAGAGPESSEAPGAEAVALGTLAAVDSIAFIDREEILEALGPFHVWTEETLFRRFHYRKPGLWVLVVRIFACSSPQRIEVSPEHAGCKTWVALDPPLATAGCRPVLDDPSFRRRRDQLRAILG